MSMFTYVLTVEVTIIISHCSLLYMNTMLVNQKINLLLYFWQLSIMFYQNSKSFNKLNESDIQYRIIIYYQNLALWLLFHKHIFFCLSLSVGFHLLFYEQILFYSANSLQFCHKYWPLFLAICLSKEALYFFQLIQSTSILYEPGFLSISKVPLIIKNCKHSLQTANFNT